MSKDNETIEVEELSMSTFKVLALIKDPAFYAALVPVLLVLLPVEIRAWVVENQAVLYPLMIVIAGHFGIRAVGLREAGKFGRQVAQPIQVIEIPDDASGLGDE